MDRHPALCGYGELRSYAIRHALVPARLCRDNSETGRAQTENLSRDIAFYVGWLGHYTADGAQPLHDTIHHDGWQGPNPHGYTTDPAIHGRFKSNP